MDAREERIVEPVQMEKKGGLAKEKEKKDGKRETARERGMREGERRRKEMVR